MRVMQIAPEITTGRGVEAVAFHLEQEWQAMGVPTGRWTLREAHGEWLPRPHGGIQGKIALAARVMWFSLVGSLLARRDAMSWSADTVVICHNDALFGDVYVNHGVVAEAMRARGWFLARMARNPLHLFTWTRDAVRFAGRTHKIVVNLVAEEVGVLQRTYPRIIPRLVVIGNGVDVDRFRPDPDSKSDLRSELGLSPGDVVALFVGHEFERKGLPLVLQAMDSLEENVHVIVVGGTDDMVASGRRRAATRGLTHRIHYVGQSADPRPYFHASDFFVFPSAYESYGLVVLEAMACGLPVISTPVGCAPDLVADGVNGFIIGDDIDSLVGAVRRVTQSDRAAMSRAARETAEKHSWASIAQRYLELFHELTQEKSR